MSADIKSINIKNRTYYFLNDLINTKNIDSRFLKMDKIRTKTFIFIMSDKSQ